LDSPPRSLNTFRRKASRDRSELNSPAQSGQSQNSTSTTSCPGAPFFSNCLKYQTHAHFAAAVISHRSQRSFAMPQWSHGQQERQFLALPGRSSGRAEPRHFAVKESVRPARRSALQGSEKVLKSRLGRPDQDDGFPRIPRSRRANSQGSLRPATAEILPGKSSPSSTAAGLLRRQ